ncbi:hypothetical protein [Bradyrhizobium elkanii]|uniref:hypothetical protein n=1 Tax=Bradyrhizobium elkanii TaxID=29448 RepID=UPI0027146C3B|nr:hypothetical protein [Bradyrhizobium elkanii]WLB05126.1 hypothetical protein QNJ80_45040 [Bradyrhizobium elkanii]
MITSSARNSSDEGTFSRANVHDRLGGLARLGGSVIALTIAPAKGKIDLLQARLIGAE